MPTLRHAPAEVQTVTIDWSSRQDRDHDALVLASGETVASSAWTVPAGLTGSSAGFGASTSTISISGGTAGATYIVRCEIVTSAGREIEQSVMIEVERR